jgi:hypothetical protein
LIPEQLSQGDQIMQNLLAATFLAFAPASIVIPHAGELTVQGTGTAFEIAQQYADAGKFGGAPSDHTCTALDVALDSMNFLGSPDPIAADWPMPPVVAKGD